MTDGQKVDTHVFIVMWLTDKDKDKPKPELGYHKEFTLNYMIRLEELEIVHTKLCELRTNLLMAYNIRDKRRREKAIREAKNDIDNYSKFIPYEIKVIFDNQVGANSLNFQHSDDIYECIDILEKLIQEEKAKVSV